MEQSTYSLITIILGSSAIGAIIASIGSYIGVSKINKKERNFAFEKEQYAILQEKARAIFGYIYDNERALQTMQTQLLHGVYSTEMVQLNRSEKETHEKKVKRGAPVQYSFRDFRAFRSLLSRTSYELHFQRIC